jgi:hypothetical protein
MERAITDQNDLRINMHKREWWCARPTKADRSDRVAVDYPYSNRRAYSRTRVTGEREAVLDHVAFLIDSDKPQFMYEHMGPSLETISEIEGKTVALIGYNLYAGD